MNEAKFVDSESLGTPENIANSDWIVMKFGGTSVSTATNWRNIADLIQNRLDDGFRVFVVHSALKDVSNTLEEILESTSSEENSECLTKLKQQHYDLADALEINGSLLLDSLFQELEELIARVQLLHEVTHAPNTVVSDTDYINPSELGTLHNTDSFEQNWKNSEVKGYRSVDNIRTRARVMLLGEIMSTRLGASYLDSLNIDVHWQDARDILKSRMRAHCSVAQSYLSATCDYEADPAMASELSNNGKVILTQGFIARNAHGDTVLLGRGGSDVSAAYFAAKLQARRLEIWTDVPGIFTADPKLVPSARLLVSLHFDEAQELVSSGSHVLHPRCLPPLHQYSIPLFIRCTEAPHISGTIISSMTNEMGPQVKGIASRNNLTLVSMDSVGMWHEVGFLAYVFTCFKNHGVSVNLISTSETNVTVSVDTVDGMLAGGTEYSLIKDLQLRCRIKIIRNCAAVSLVGRKIRTILPRIAPAFEVFEEEKIHLVSQAADDLNFSFVIDQEQAPKLINKLHASIIRKFGGDSSFGPNWEELFQGGVTEIVREPPWWLQKRDNLLDLAEQHFNAYVYNADSVRNAANCLLKMNSLDRVLYAVKANFNTKLLKILAEIGVDFECVSLGEINLLFETIPNLDKSRILFTPNFAARTEYEWAIENGLQVTLDNLYPLKAWPEVFIGQKLFIRIDPGQGYGHHEHVKTAGLHSKFGIPSFEADELLELLNHAKAEVIGIHAHSGSGILDPENWRTIATEVIKIAERFTTVKYLDLGGGLGISEKPGDEPFDIDKLDETLASIKTAYPHYQLWLEPGRFLVAQAGVLLTHVTQVKGKGDMRYVGVGTGMNSLIRPALYGAYHEIVNLTKVNEPPTESVTIVGPICETGDRFGSDRLLPVTEENDVILIANTGAYGYVMSSNYNLRKVTTELVI
jgi:diaminopimelate decarboxylase/aspartate kinase